MSKRGDARAARKAKKIQKKQPKTSVGVPTAKKPVPGPPVEGDGTERIMFRMSLMDGSGPWGFAGLSTDDVKRIAAACKSFESMTRNELINVSGNKPIDWESMCNEAQGRAAELELNLFGDGLWELRLSGTGRLWGLLDGHCFYVVWWDPDHEVCPSMKRNT